nr:hypothetical protein [Limosilactobacillus reuteri]
MADAGYGSKRNYKYIEDQLPDCTALIPYSTMLKEIVVNGSLMIVK